MLRYRKKRFYCVPSGSWTSFKDCTQCTLKSNEYHFCGFTVDYNKCKLYWNSKKQTVNVNCTKTQRNMETVPYKKTLHTGVKAFQSYYWQQVHVSHQHWMLIVVWKITGTCIWHAETYHFISTEVNKAWKNYEVTKTIKDFHYIPHYMQIYCYRAIVLTKTTNRVPDNFSM